MQLTVARGAMRMIANMGTAGHLESIGLSEDDFNKVTGKLPWLGTDRNRMTQALNTLLTTTLDVLGIPRHTLCAEYVAAGIALFVHPVNAHVACRFMENAPSAMALGRGADEAEICSSKQLFALVVQLVADPERSHARILFERNTGIILDKVTKEQMRNGEVNYGEKIKPKETQKKR